MRLIDTHTHCFPDAVAPKAITALTAAYGLDPTFDGTVSGLVRLMDEESVDVSVVLPVATKPEQVESINRWAASSQSQRVVCFGAIHPAHPDPASVCSSLIDSGIKGAKLQPNWQQFRPDAPEAEPMYDAIERAGLILYFHAGDEIDGSWEIVATPGSIAEVHRRHPGITIVAAHLGGYLMWERSREHLIGRAVYLDTSFCRDQDISDAEYADLIRDHGPDRVLLGSDAPCDRPTSQKTRVERLPLSDVEKQGILFGNAARLLGLQPS